MTNGRWKPGAASRRRDKWRVRRSLATDVVIIAIWILNVDLGDCGFLMSWKEVIVVNA